MDKGACRSFVGKEKKSISRLSVYSNDDRSLPQPRWKEYNVINLQQSFCLISFELLSISLGEVQLQA